MRRKLPIPCLDLIPVAEAFGLVVRAENFFRSFVSRPMASSITPCPLLRPAPYQRLIHPGDRMLFKLGRQGAMRLVGLGNDHHTGSFFVQAMDQTRPFLSTHMRRRDARCRKVMQ